MLKLILMKVTQEKNKLMNELLWVNQSMLFLRKKFDWRLKL